MPTVASIYTPLRALLRDSSTFSNYEWPDSVILGYITDGVQEARRELSMADADYFLTVGTFSLTNGQEVYTPFSDIRKVVKIQRVDLSPPQVVNPVTFEDTLALDQISIDPTSSWQTYYLFTGNDIRIFPKPTTNISNAVRVVYEQEIVPSGGYTTTSTTVGLPDDWIRFAIYAAAATALLQDEQNPGAIYNLKESLRRRLVVDYRDRNKGRMKKVRYISAGYDADYPWGI